MAFKFNPLTGKFDLVGGSTAETDPVVGAITGIVKADGAGAISAAAVDTDYLAPSSSIDKLSDVDTTTAAPNTNEVLKWNGSNWVPAVYNATFAFSNASFSDGEATTQLIGTGTWKAIGALTFTATYNNGPPTSAYVTLASDGGVTWGANLDFSTPFATVVSTETTAYPSTKDKYIQFTLHSAKGAETDTDSETAIYFRNYVYWGAINKNSGFTEADVEGLSGSSITNSYTTSRSINATAGLYVVIAFPSSYTSIPAGDDYEDDGGTGFLFNSVSLYMKPLETVSITNSAGFTENYKVYASNSAALGNSTLQLSTSAQSIDKLYYGITTSTSGFTEGDIEGLANSSVTNDNTQTWSSVTTGVGEYMLFAFPKRLGIPTFYVGGFEGGFESPETVSVTNVNGWTEDYYVWRSTNSNLGATVVTTA